MDAGWTVPEFNAVSDHALPHRQGVRGQLSAWSWRSIIAGGKYPLDGITHVFPLAETDRAAVGGEKPGAIPRPVDPVGIAHFFS